MEVFSLFVFWALLCLGVAALASSRGRSGFGFFLLSFFFSPILGLIVVLVMKNLTEEAAIQADRRYQEERREQERRREHEKQLESLRALKASPAQEPVANPIGTSHSVSVADELAKLAALQEKGVLTTEEFVEQKRALLARSAAV